MKFLFAWRYFKSKKSTTAINIIAWISVVAIAFGTAALIILLSVFNGFEGLVKGLYGDFYSDLKIIPSSGKVISLTPEQIDAIKKTKNVQHLSLIAEEKAVLVNGDYQSIIFLRGVDDAYASVNRLTKHIIRGKYTTGSSEEPALVIGAGIENAVGADPLSGFPLTVYIPNNEARSIQSDDALRSYNLNTAGTFMVQQEFDNKYAFTNLEFLKYMLNLKPDEYNGVEISITKSSEIDKTQQLLQQLLGKNYTVQSRYQQNQSLYKVMQLEKWFMYIVLSLILVVAAFNMIGALTMLVLEKQKDIAVLKALGASQQTIQQIFLSEGFVLAGIGAGTGIVLALITCYLQVTFKLIPLQGGSFIIDYYPVKLIATDFLLVPATVFVIALISSWIPSRKAATQQFSLKS